MISGPMKNNKGWASRPPGGAAGRGAPLAAQRRFELSNTAAASDKCSRRLGSLPNWNTLQINGRVDPP